MTSSVLSELLGRPSPSLDDEMANFIHQYLNSLQLNFELVMTRGEGQRLQLILEDIEDLLTSTWLRLSRY